MILDSRTLVVVALLLTLMLCAAHFLTWWINRGVLALKYCAAGDLIAAFTFLLVAMRGPEPPVLMLMVTNAALAAVHLCLWRAVRFFTGQALPVRTAAALIGVYLLGAFYFSTVEPSLNARLAVAAAFAATMGVLAARDLLRDADGIPARAVGCILLFNVLLNVLRGAMALSGAPMPDLLAPSPAQTLSFLTNMLVFIALGIVFIIMTTERLQDDLRRVATYDALTGILNRRAFLDQAEREVARSHRSGAPYALLIMDIDHFKRINDTYGHQAGDAVLKAIAAAIQATLRPTDLFGRYGGEEFCILLPDTGLDAAQAVAERVRSIIARAEVVHCGRTITTSVSIGVAESSPAAQGFDSAVADADLALYRAKDCGRNRVAVHRPDVAAAEPAGA